MRVHELAAPLVTADEDALEREFEVLLAENSSLAFRVAYGVLRHRQDAEDVAQEAFVRAHRRFRQLRDRRRFRGWLARMTWRLAIDRRRGDRRRAARELAHGGPAALEAIPADETVSQSERAEVLWKAIDELSEKLRIVLVLAAIEGHDVAEVARLLDLPEGTVKSRLFAARQQLKERLQ
jgi:RNA polymerase sigma-70 factor (ECF subfamily)